jgi:hypothetical protein
VEGYKLANMRDAIIYSFHVREDSLDNNRCYKQLRYSIHTLRKFNKYLPVYVYISSEQILESPSLGENVTVVSFSNHDEPGWPESWTNLGYQQFLRHRWENAISSITDFELDNVLYLDTDTVFYGDPKKLFDKYGNTDNLWAKPDNSEHIMSKVEVWPGMNDGQFLLSKRVASSAILDHIKFYVNHTLEHNKIRLSREEHLSLHWLAVQYAVFDYFKNINNPVLHFDENEVMLHLEPTYKDTSNLVIQHYYNGNFEKVVPREFW